jgi:AraC family transcriptional regulator
MPTDSHIVAHPSGVLGGVPDAPVGAGAFAVTLTRLPTRLRLPPHYHRQATLNVVLDGEYSETIGRGAARTFGPATMIAKPAGTVHSNEVGPASVECLVIEVPDQSPRGFDEPPRRSAMIAKSGGRLRAELARRDDITPMVVEALVLELLAELWEAPPLDSAQRWLDRARDLLHDEPGPRVLTDLAREVDRHPIYLARAFRARFGSSVGEYARCLRVERARRLLHHRALPISEVAARAGYSDQSHLTRDFRRAFGQSPGSYRRLIRRVP